MCITKCSPDCKLSHPSTEIKATEICRDSISLTSSKYHDKQSFILRLTGFIIPPVRVKKLEVGKLYVRRRGHKKAFIVKTKEGVQDGSRMRDFERELACERERLLRRRADLLRQKEQKLKNQSDEKAIEEIIARLRSDLLEEREGYIRQKEELKRANCSIRHGHGRRSVHFADPNDAFTSTRSSTTREGLPREYDRRRTPYVQRWTCETDSDDSSDSDDSLLVDLTEVRPSSTFAIPVFEDPVCKACSPHRQSFSSCRCDDCCDCGKDFHRCRQHDSDCRSQSIIIGQSCRRMRGRPYNAGGVAVETRHPRDYQH